MSGGDPLGFCRVARAAIRFSPPKKVPGFPHEVESVFGGLKPTLRPL